MKETVSQALGVSGHVVMYTTKTKAEWLKQAREKVINLIHARETNLISNNGLKTGCEKVFEWLRLCIEEEKKTPIFEKCRYDKKTRAKLEELDKYAEGFK